MDALRELAFCQKRLERYEEAKETFKNLGIEIGSPYEYRREINTCDIAMGWKKIQTPEFRVSLLEFNTQAAEYAPSLYNDKELVFTSDRSSSTGEGVYGWTGNKFSDLFVVNLENQTVRNFSQPWNSTDNEGAISFAANYQEAYFTRCSGGKKEDAYCQIMVSTLRNNTWTAPKPLEFQEPNINYGHPSISADGKKLYFSCNHPDGWGGYDIYVSDRTEEGWSPPKVLSRTVNTIGNEQFPYIDGDTLYFSSDFHPGMGGLDVFRTYRMKSGIGPLLLTSNRPSIPAETILAFSSTPTPH
ncbi:MAG: PD40 domain-containing protein [Haliscomenobacter sp.]|nr:PD40 domain-containing protein [Haliscomenobacter sp.]